jgi:rubrerythrin
LSIHDNRDEIERKEAVKLLREQILIEGKLVGLYERTAGEISKKPVRHLLHMINMDSRKHIDICQTALEILEGDDVLREEKAELLAGMEEHMRLEEESIERSNKILRNIWIRENKALTDLIRSMRDDEKRHHQALKRLSRKTFFRLEPGDVSAIIQGNHFAEERYKRSKEFWSKKREDEESK